ncbi:MULTISPECIES: RNA polymerase sigma factor [Sphingobacterium]|uniref:RNA polymerase sigma factor n=1 Tax=Sphingobacterium TaxID=28453 RepID=UPI00191B474B|nr:MULTISPECIES: RNA polymerase sigma-70 factor [Sphingobacterium]QQT27146.1 RNA polymerase sigma-70 factor [Sphingobacterium spiritivorum]
MLNLKITSLHNEHTLLVAISNGDHKSFETLFLHYYKPFGNYVYKLLEDISLTEDVLQEVFLRIWTDRENLHTITSFKDYLFIITRNRVYNLLNEKSRKSVLFESLDETATFKQIPQEEEEQKADLELYYTLLEQEINNLPLQQQKIFRLSKLKKMKYEEIARMLDISVETVRKHMYLANQTLKTKLKGKEGGVLLVILSAVYQRF